MNKNIIFHIDVNNAFLSWSAIERLKSGDKLDIRTIPCVVAGDESKRRGVVVAKSYPAKEKGVATAEPLYMARRKVSNLLVIPGDYDKYNEYSNRLYEYLCNYSPNIERYSIDECFLDMTGTETLFGDPVLLAHKIRNEIKEKFGFTVNIGIGNNKLCAKMASDFEKPDKVHTLFEDEVETKLWPLPVRELFMIGKKSSEILNKIGVVTIEDLAKLDLEVLKKHFKTSAITMHNYAWGIDDSKVEEYVPKNQGISNSATVPEDLICLQDINKVLYDLAHQVGLRLRNMNYYALVVTVSLKNSDFIIYSHQQKLTNPINTDKDIYEVSTSLAQKMWKKDPIRLVAIRLNNFADKKYEQISIFEEIKTKENDEKMQQVVDNINKKYGKEVVITAKNK
ncbi:MAG TPA: DNA polymerase IV [Bacilli bacterium]|nr:DNA polymerase IV [Bacilli bacterium]